MAAEYARWFEENNFELIPEVKVTEDAISGLGIVAVKSLPEGSIVGRIPGDKLICYQNSPLKDVIESHLDRLLVEYCGDWIPTALSLLHELNTPDSLWRPYLNTLPSMDGPGWLPFHWPASELEAIEGTDLADDMADSIERMKQAWDEVVRPFVTAHSKDFPALAPVTREAFFHACYLIMSYSFQHEAWGTVMAPHADTYNHRTVGGATVRMIPDGDGFLAKTISNVDAGDELWNTYGELDSAELLLKYGFIETQPNPHDQIRVSGRVVLELLPEAADADFAVLEQALDVDLEVLGGLGEMDFPIELEDGAASCSELTLAIGVALGKSPEECWPPCKDIREVLLKILDAREALIIGRPTTAQGKMIVEWDREMLKIARQQFS